jgi:hypothetical protein
LLVLDEPLDDGEVAPAELPFDPELPLLDDAPSEPPLLVVVAAPDVDEVSVADDDSLAGFADSPDLSARESVR